MEQTNKRTVNTCYPLELVVKPVGGVIHDYYYTGRTANIASLFFIYY